MTETMRAAVLSAGQRGVEIEDLPVPQPRAGEVLVKVAACGVCHSDLHIMNADIPFPRPCTLGHEISGTIVEVGAGVARLSAGERVVAAFIMPCGACRHCVRGRDDMCEAFFSMNRGQGVLFDGTTRLQRSDGTPVWMYSMAGLAEYSVVPATDVFALPPSVDLTDAAIVGCSLFTSYGAVRHGADLRVGETIAVFGVGGVGMNIVQMTSVFGASRIVAVDLDDDKLAVARSLGATDVVNGSGRDAAEQIREITAGLGVDVAFEAVGLRSTFEQAFVSARDGGRMVAVGLGAATSTASIGINHLVRRGITVKGSFGARTRADMPELIDMLARGDLGLEALITRRVGLDEVRPTYEALERGEIVGRAIVDMELA